MPFSRKMESEADYIGLKLMAQACYNPSSAIAMWQVRFKSNECIQRMKHVDKQHVPEYISTHPSHGKNFKIIFLESRIEKIKEWMPEAEQAQKNSDCEHVKM